MTDAAPAPDKHLRLRINGAGLLAMGMFDAYIFIVPLWAVLIGANATEIGILVGVRAILPGLFTIHGGVLMDRFGPRGVMTVFIVVLIILGPLYPSLPAFIPLLILQLFVGLALTLQWVGAQTMIAQLSRGKTSHLGHFTFASRIGTFIAPVVFGVLWDLTNPWVCFLGASVWAAVLLALTMSIPKAPKQNAAPAQPFRFRDIVPRPADYVETLKMLAIPAIAVTICACFLRNSTTSMQGSIYVVYLNEIGLTGTVIGALFAVIEAGSGIGSLLAGPITRRFPAMSTLVAVTGLAIALIAITPFLGGVIVFLFAAQILRGLVQGIHQPVTFAIQSRAVAHDRQGAAVALRVTSNRFSAMIIPPLMGFIADTWGIAPSFFILGGGLILLTVVLWFCARRLPEVPS